MKPRGRGSGVMAIILLSCCAALLIGSAFVRKEAPSADGYRSARRYEAAWAVSMPQGNVRVNEADAATLTRLPGIGAGLAAAILDDRASRGPFAYPEDLLTVAGIGVKRLQAIWAWLSMEGANP